MSEDAKTPNPLTRVLKIALVVFALVGAGLAVTAFVAGDPEKLPFEYEGFD